MTTVITHARRKSHLASLIDSAGGVTVGVALTRARENIAALRTRGLEEVARHIRDLAEATPPDDAGARILTLERIYQSANHIIDAAAPFELEEICAVAFSLCDMADRAAGEEAFDWRVIEVHIQTLRLLNGLPAGAAAERARVAADLAAMVARKFAQAG